MRAAPIHDCLVLPTLAEVFSNVRQMLLQMGLAIGNEITAAIAVASGAQQLCGGQVEAGGHEGTGRVRSVAYLSAAETTLLKAESGANGGAGGVSCVGVDHGMDDVEVVRGEPFVLENASVDDGFRRATDATAAGEGRDVKAGGGHDVEEYLERHDAERAKGPGIWEYLGFKFLALRILALLGIFLASLRCCWISPSCRHSDQPF